MGPHAGCLREAPSLFSSRGVAPEQFDECNVVDGPRTVAVILCIPRQTLVTRPGPPGFVACALPSQRPAGRATREDSGPRVPLFWVGMKRRHERRAPAVGGPAPARATRAANEGSSSA